MWVVTLDKFWVVTLNKLQPKLAMLGIKSNGYNSMITKIRNDAIPAPGANSVIFGA